MSILSEVIGGNIAELFTKIVGTFKLSPEKAAELEGLKQQHIFELAKIQADADARMQEAITKEVEAASANIQAEAKSGDKYTSRARPTFLYLVYVILGFNFIVAPLAQSLGAYALTPLPLPQELYWLFGSGYLGYTGARTWEKVGNAIK